MNLSEFIRNEKLFISIAIGLILIFCYLGTEGGDKKTEEAPPVKVLFLSWAEIVEAVQSGWISPLIVVLLNLVFAIFITFLIAGFTLNLSGWLKQNWRMFSPGPSPEVDWGIWPVVKIFVYFVFLFFLFQIIEGHILAVLGLKKAKDYSLLLLVNTLVQDMLIIILVFAFLKKFKYPPATLRLKFRDWYSRLRQAIRGYVFFFPFLIVLIWVSVIITRALGIDFEPPPLVETLLEKENPFLLGALFCIGVFLASLVEEIFFRGFVYPAVKRRVPVFWAILISAALFSTLHLNWGGWLPIFGLGVLLAYSYEKTGSLLVPIFIHAIHNALFLIYALLLFKISQAV